jgi:hypothetical protein
LFLGVAPAWPDTTGPGWDPSRLSVPVVIDGRTIPYPEFALYVMPGHRLEVGLEQPAEDATVRYLDRTMPLARSTVTAPERPGLSRLEIENAATGEVAVINVFTQVPTTRIEADGVLNGYRIGRYPDEPLRGLDSYRPPAGLVEVTPENRETRVSPNFRLGQFISKQEQGYPKYVALRENLLLKLERILAALNHSGRPTRRLVVMSGYRTPWYNQAIGNVAYSRHVWGGAADIYIDESPADGVMDDLDGNGRVDRGDAEWLAAFVEAMYRRGELGSREGGLGIYDSNAVHGPFIHVDVRGSRARW